MKDMTCARYGAKHFVSGLEEVWTLPGTSSPHSAPLKASWLWVECVTRVYSGLSGVREVWEEE